MSVTSYSQNFEDVLLWRVLKDQRAGMYVDVGANDPHVFSVSRLFHEKGIPGVHIEPVPEFAEDLKRARPGDRVLQVALSNSKNPIILYNIPGTGLSTVDKSIADRHRSQGFPVEEIQVTTETLENVLDDLAGQEVHWLKIDVEGAEADVLASWNSSAVRPWIVVVESTLPNTQIESYQEWEGELISRDYTFAYFDGLNRYYVHDQHIDLIPRLNVQPNVFDEFQLTLDSAFTHNIKDQFSTLQLEKIAADDLLSRQAELFSASLDRALAAQAAEASDNRVRLDAALAEARSEVQRTHVRLQAALGEAGQLAVKLSDAEVVMTALRGELEETRSARDVAVNQFSSLSEEKGQLTEEVSALKSQYNDLLEALRLSNIELDALKGNSEQYRVTISRLRRDGELARTSLLAEVAELKRLHEEEVNFRHRQINEVTNLFRHSLSWRVTAPVRAIGAAVRKLKILGKDKVRRGLLFGLQLVRKHSWLRNIIRPVVSINPKLRNRLAGLSRTLDPSRIDGGRSASIVMTADPASVAAWKTALQENKAVKDSGASA